jgi:hypothetical protein
MLSLYGEETVVYQYIDPKITSLVKPIKNLETT